MSFVTEVGRPAQVTVALQRQWLAPIDGSFFGKSHSRRVVEIIGRSSAVSDCLARRGTRWRSALANSSVVSRATQYASMSDSSVAITWALLATRIPNS